MVGAAIRSLIRRAGSSVTIITMLAIAIGVNTAIYSVAKAVVFAPLPFPHPEQLVQIFEGDVNERYQPGGENMFSSVRPGMFQDWHTQARSFQSMSVGRRMQATLMSENHASVVDGFQVDDAFFQTLGVPARLGRYLMAEDYSGNSRVVVLGDRIWREHYNADPAVVGRNIVLDGATNKVVGVMPPGFLPTRNDRDPQVWLPLVWNPETKYSRVMWGHFVYARLKDGVTLNQAQAEMDGIAARIHMAFPDCGAAPVVPLDAYLFGNHERLFTLLLVAAGLVLLIACANVANLLLARALERQHEFAVRSALGASRKDILRQVFIESLVLAGIGGLLGAALSPLLVRPALALLPRVSRIPRLDQVHLDWNVLLFTLLISTGAGLLFGMAPALRASSSKIALVLKSRGRTASTGRNEGRLNDALLIGEVAFSVVLLVGGALLTHIFLKQFLADPGFRPAQSVALQLVIPTDHYGTYESGGKNVLRQQLYTRLNQAAQSLANIEAAGLCDKLPLRQFWNPWGFSIDGRPPLTTGLDGYPAISSALGIPVHGGISVQIVSPGYFPALGIPLVRGRLLNEHDGPNAPMVAVINEATARRYFPGEDPVGKPITLEMTSFAPRMTIVGVVGDIRMDGMDHPAAAELFWPTLQIPSANTWLVARTRDNTGSIASALRQVVQTIDPEIGVVETTSMSSEVGNSIWRERFSAVLLGLFATLALLLAAGGLYAVISHAVERKSHELGVRLVLGANTVHIARAVLGHGIRVWAVGVTLGILLALTVGRLLVNQVYRIGELAWMLPAVASLLLILTIAACLPPLRRALTLDPLMTLKSE